MRICLVMGAGASLANAQFFRPVRRTATHPPLDFTFFQKIAELGIEVPNDLQNYAKGYPREIPLQLAVSEQIVWRSFCVIFSMTSSKSGRRRLVSQYLHIVG